jgi:A/G-specific adenine glycosylase
MKKALLPDASLSVFRGRLLEWYAANQRALPWRGARHPYRIWVSEVMLQQTRVAAVADYYRRFLRRFPTVQALARARSEEVLRHWAGLGYYRRARHLHRAAREVVARHAGRFPRDYAAARKLPGVGPYTAAAVTSIAYGAPHAVLDGNVARVLARLHAIRGDLRAPRRWKQLQALAQALLPVKAARRVAPSNGRKSTGGAPPSRNPGDWNQAMMELGATVCTPRAPRCGECPVARWCQARTRGLTEHIPAARKKRTALQVRLAAAVAVDRRGRTMLVRDNLEYFSRMWHFPAALAGPAAQRKLLRSLFTGEDDNLTHRARRDGETAEKLAEVRHTVTFRQIRITPFLVLAERLPAARNGNQIVPLRRLEKVAVSSLTRKIARAALQRLGQE